MTGAAEPLVRVEGLSRTFTVRRPLRWGRTVAEPLHAVDDVSFDLSRGETVGLVGESGSGKSTIARAILRLIEPTAGRVTFDGIDLGGLDAEELRRLRRRMQMVFQDASSALDSRLSIGFSVQEPLRVHGIGDRDSSRARAREVLERVGIRPDQLDRLPHALSGGQRQRVGLARALVTAPDLLLLDEPVSAVDVSIQAQVLNLLGDLQAELGLTSLLIVHDLAVAEHACDRVIVIYLGQVMEAATSEELFRAPLHPYTASLLSAVPIPDPRIEAQRPRIVLRGEVEAPIGERRGCPFRSRCPVGHDRAICADERPPPQSHSPTHQAACHFPGELGR
jgi:oligopeptide/dipeptide ABC transporter ATP-binding protein